MQGLKRLVCLLLSAVLLLGTIPLIVMASEVTETECDHSYESVVTAPTCTEQGYTTYTCACGESYIDSYVDATGHSYAGTFVCNECGYEAKVSVLGDSISTYSGISDVKNAVYPNSTVKSVLDTWWQQVIDTLGGKLLKVNASGGSRILSDEYFNGNGIRNGNYAAYRDRCVNLHVGDETPDVVLVFMGTNDFSYHVESGCEKCQILLACTECTARQDGNLNICAACRAASGVYSSFCNLPLGTADSVDVSVETPSSSCEAYAIMLNKMKAEYPDAQIYCLGLLPRVNPYQDVVYHDHGQPTVFNAELKKVAENAGATFIDLEQCIHNSEATWSTYFGDAVHPTATGMDKISEAVISNILGNDEVYMVSSELAGGVTLSGDSLVIAGEAYEASIITTNSELQLNVQITMNGEDITEAVYNGETGKINIANVTGNLVVTVKAKVIEDEITWTIGTISTINGSNADNYPNRIRTGFISIREGVIVRAVNNALINVVFYDENYKILTAGNNCGWTTEWTSTNVPAATVYIRVAAKDESDMILTVEYGKNITLIRGCAHTYENGICTGCGNINIEWEIGTIAAASGLNSANSTRLRTVDYLLLSNFAGVSVDMGYQLTWLAYDADKNYIGNGTTTFTGSWQDSGESISTEEVQSVYSDAVYFRLALKSVSSSTLTLDDAITSGVMFYAFGEELPEPEYELDVEDVLTIGSWQDGAIWDNKLFVLGSGGTGVVYDLTTLTPLDSLTLDQKDILKPHANSVCFGSTYYAEGDKYPLLYVNIYNNYASAEDRMEGTCCIYRVIESDGKFTTELVQMIRIGFVEDLTLWKSKESNGDVRPYGNFVVDTDNQKLYAFVMRDADKTTRFFCFNIPALTAGTYSETYGCNVVTLESDDIEQQFDTEYFNYLQGSTYSSGMLISAEGFNSGGSAEPAIRIIDLETGMLSTTYYMANSGLAVEPEVICVDPATGLLYYATADGVLRILTIPDVHFHTYTPTVTAPTCTEQGYTTHTCACGYSYIDSYTSATGHTYGAWTEVTAPLARKRAVNAANAQIVMLTRLAKRRQQDTITSML